MKSTILFKSLKMAAIFSLSLGLIFTSCSKSGNSTPPTDKTALQKAVDSAQFYYDHTVEGSKPGDYTVGSKTNLKSALDAAKAILADPTSNQATLTNAAANLQGAINTYKAAYIGQIAAANLIGFWQFNGNAKDSSGNGHDGVVTAGHAYFGAGMPTLTADRFGRANSAYHFDMGGNIDIPYSLALNPQQMSISLWMRKDTVGRKINTDTYTFIAMNRWNGYKFQLQSTNRPFYTVKVFEPSPKSDTTIYDRDDALSLNVDSNWYHVVVTYKAGFEDFYVNGTLVKEYTDVPGNPIVLTNPIDLVIGQDLPTNVYTSTDDGTGRFYVNYGGFFTGDMDDVMFYNIALTGPQVQSIYTNQKTL